MPFINIPKKVLTENLVWDIDRTFFELYPISNLEWVFLFACHFGHTDVRIKINLPDLLKTEH